MMKLTRFKVTNYRSVKDSGWVDVDDVTALIGVNEAGKTNLLLPLWKLKPAQEGAIEGTSDFPKTMFGEIRDDPGGYSFIEAEFNTGAAAEEIAQAAGTTARIASTVRVTRFFNGEYKVEFPEHQHETTVKRNWLTNELKRCGKELDAAKPLASENQLHEKLRAGTRDVAKDLPVGETIRIADLKRVGSEVRRLIPRNPKKTSKIVPPLQKLSIQIAQRISRCQAPRPGQQKDAVKTVVEALPPFVYYSNYGNLDSEIYLPHVVENLKREDLGTKEAAKARTLRVLFRFVRLKANEILELGQEFQDKSGQGQKPTDEQIEEIAQQKKVRSILLQSAGVTLTEKFRDWWKQGDYRFRFEADGNHFRIWVADDRRPTEVELENRSSGLQWFLSFYLVFLVESRDQHRNAVLLLDEPGISLHPHAQRDLSAFFESLSKSNQLMYTSHSPFLVDADRLERARKVYIAPDGTTKATPDLRHSEGKDKQTGAAYAVHSALNLSVAESLLLGCQPVLVEGPSDQHYLTTIKALLISAGKITPARELVFPPSGGTRTARVVASILTGRDETLPKILLDADTPGQQMAGNLKSGLYADAPDRVLSVADFANVKAAEIEDLFPPKFLAEELDRMEREPETRLVDVVKEGSPFVGQAEDWAEAQAVALDKHWKVNLSTKAKKRALGVGIGGFDKATVERWVKLFEAFEG